MRVRRGCAPRSNRFVSLRIRFSVVAPRRSFLLAEGNNSDDDENTVFFGWRACLQSIAAPP